MRTSESLLIRVRDRNDGEAWESFVAIYTPLIYHWASQHGLGSHDALDLVQEVMGVLLERMGSFQYDPELRFRSWLATVVRNKLRERYRRESIRQTQHLSDDGVVCTPTDVLEADEYRRYVTLRALEIMRGEFSESHWKACWATAVEGRSAAEVAAELGLSPNGVYLAKSRVLKRLRERLEGLLE